MKGMSDWNLAELEEINWDELGKNDDHMVPYQAGELADGSLCLSDSHKKPRYEVENDAGKNMYSRDSANKTILLGNENAYYPRMKDGSSSILKGSRSHTSNIVVPELRNTDYNATGTSLLSQDVRISDYCGNESNRFMYRNMGCSNDSNQDIVSANDNNKSGLSKLNCMSSGVADHSFLQNERKDRDSDLVYNDWPDISNFEEIDKMFRNWDSTFGQGQTGTADELSWFSSSSNTNFGLEFGFESGLQSSDSELGALHAKLEPPHSGSYVLPPDAPETADPDKPSSSIYTDWPGAHIQSKASSADEKKLCDRGDKMKNVGHSQINDAYCLDESGSSTVMIKRQQLSEGKGTKRSTDQMLLDSGVSDISASQMYSTQKFSQQKHFIGSSPSYPHNIDHSSQLEFGLPTHQVPYSMTAASSKLGKETDQSSSYKAPYRLLDHPTQCPERLADKFYTTGMAAEENRRKLYQRQQLCSIMTTEHSYQQPSFQKKALDHKRQLETGGDSEMEDMGEQFPAFDIDHHEAQGSFSDDISEKATSFQQLQDVMHQLDDRTKLCIRDSLYRLARSASQRHNFTNQNCNGSTNNAKGKQCSEASMNKLTDLMDAETNTNPIDRSIAHLLFHNPSETASRPADDARSLESRIMAMVPNQFDQQQVFGGCEDMHNVLPL